MKYHYLQLASLTQTLYSCLLPELEDNGIMAYGQDLGDAGFASVRYGMGRGIDDRIAIIVPSDKADNAKQVIKEMGLEQNVTH